MINAAKTRAAVSTAAVADHAAARTLGEDADLFASELGSRLTDAASGSAISSTLAKLAAAFPGMAISTNSADGFSSIKDYRLGYGSDSSITIGSDMMAQMAEDKAMLDKVTEMLSRVFAAGKEQSLVGSGGSNISRNVNIQGAEVRYVEVRRSASGTQMSVSSLAMNKDELVSDTLDQLFAQRNQGNAPRGFEGLVTSSASWRFESFVSGQAAGQVFGDGSSAATQTLMASQAFSASLEVVIEGWAASGGTGQDLLSYIRSMQLSDPLVLDLDGDGINLTSAGDGVYFDIRGDGSPVRTAFISGGDAFLYLDKDGNGVVDDVSELFGDHGEFADGFSNLAQYDENGDGVIDEKDSIYRRLRLWRDTNGDGICREDETMSLAGAGVASLSLARDNRMELDANGNVIGDRSTFTRTDGTTGMMADVWLRSI